MMANTLSRRRLVLALAAGSALPGGVALAQSGGPVAFPYYSGEQALQGLYGQHLPPLARDFETQANALVLAAQGHCAGQVTLADLRQQWRQTLVAWQTLATPAVGPLVSRRSQRQIDFWPPRPNLLSQAVQRAPGSLADLDRIGTPAKGFPALELLLWNVPPGTAPVLHAASCQYAALLAQSIAAEAQALRTELDPLARKDWTESPEDAVAAFAEWINQWLGGLERLRWAHIEKPIQSHRTHALGNALKGNPVLFPRLTREANLADWRAQWASLRSLARLPSQQRQAPPLPGQAFIPIEALLIGKGQLALADRWGKAIDAVDAGMATLSPQASARELLALSQRMKAVTVLYQNEVAAALDVPLGFSDADGD